MPGKHKKNLLKKIQDRWSILQKMGELGPVYGKTMGALGKEKWRTH